MPTIQPVDWLAIAPPLVVALTAVLVLVVDAFLPVGRRGVNSVLALLGLLAGLLLMLPLAGSRRGAFCLASNGSACSFVVDNTTLAFQLIAAGGAAVVVLLSTRPSRGAGLPAGEYHFLLLASASGAMSIAASRDLITLVVSLELVTLPAIGLVGLRRGSGRAAEAALKFFLVSVVSVAVMLFGVALVYGVTGEMNFGLIGAVLAAGGTPGFDLPRGVAAVAVVLTLVGLAFKVAAVPFHFWVPETYSGAPVPVAAYLSVVSKGAGLVGLLLVVDQAFGAFASVWSPVLGVLAALTMTLGNLVALRQRDAVRLLAWSSIAQAGYLLVPLGSARSPAVGDSLLGAMVAYLLIYAVVNLGAFAAVAVLARGGPGGSLDDFRGLFWKQRGLALLLAFFLLGLAGLPPGIAGLFGKVVVFQAAVEGGAGWLAVVMAVNVVIGLAYYLYWAALLFTRPAPETVVEEQRQRIPLPAVVALGVTGVLAIVLSVAPNLALKVIDTLPL
ncbi:NADH-quinone oxidoreductase subunit N [Flindersiella endophytica]